jgi:DnaJ-class molecular chaperone
MHYGAGAAGSLNFDPKINYYNILGLKESAKEHEIKKAFYALAKKYHPDSNGDDTHKSKLHEEKFKEVSSAYEVLGDTHKKCAYDETRKQFTNGGF